MKKIGIDCRLINQTGVGVYIRNLLFYLPKSNNIRYSLFLMNKSDLPEEIKRNDYDVVRTPYKWHSLSEQTYFLRSILKENLDLMHFTYFSYPLFYRKNFIATIHDVTPLYFKTGKSAIENRIIFSIKNKIFKKIIYHQIKFSKHIIVPSFSVQNELLKINPNLKSKIIVSYEGLDYRFYKKTKNVKKITECSKYFLYVGNFYPHKNIKRLLMSWKFLKEKIHLLLVGPEDIFSDHLKKFAYKENIQRIKWLHDLNFDERIACYANAFAFIHPSLSEGFGLPLIEAMYFNLPIIASNIPVFNELLENQYFSFNPLDIKNMSYTINQFLKSKTLFKRYISTYSKMLKKYSFRTMSEKTFSLYKKMLYG